MGLQKSRAEDGNSMRLDLNEPRESKPVVWTEEVWRGVSLGAAWALGAFSMAMALRGRGASWGWVLGGWTLLGFTCTASGLLRPLLLDLFAQFHYREKFALFLAHLVVWIAPVGVMGRGWFLTGLVLVVISVSFQLVYAVNFHRYLVLCAVLAIVGFWNRPAGATVWGLAWCGLAGMTLLTERIRFSLEDLRGPAPPVAPGTVVEVAILYIGVPLLIAGLVAWWVPAPPPPPPPVRVVQPKPGISPQEIRSDAETVKRIMWQALGLSTAIAVAVAFLYWYSAMQSKKKGKQPEIKELVVAAEAEAVGPPPPRPALDPLEGKERRLEIFRQFRRLERTMDRLDQGRRGSWTVREYLRWLLTPVEQEAAPLSAGRGEEKAEFGSAERTWVQTYEKARYAEEEPTAEQVEGFRKEVGRLINTARKQKPANSESRPGSGKEGAATRKPRERSD